MATFTYSARDRLGNKTAGSVTAKDTNEARQALRLKELYVTDIKQKTDQAGAAGSFSLFRKRKVKLGDMVVMSRQLASLVRAGISIIECLAAVAEQSENPLLTVALQDVRLNVMTGSTLTDAMRKHPKIFNDKYTSLVQAGETGGLLEQTLETAAEQLDKEAELQEKIKAAFVYPGMVLMVSIGVVIFMLVFIVPVFDKVYQQFHAVLPPVTQSLVTLSYILLHYWWMVLIGLFVTIHVLKRYLGTPGGRRVFDRLTLKLPLMGKLIRKVAVARFTQTFSGAVSAGVPIMRALAISADTSGNTVMIEAITQVISSIKAGSTLSVPLEATGQFPPMVTRMIAAGEQSGNLEEMLTEITKFYGRDIEYAVQKLTRIMEPAMTIVVGGIVLFILLALYMPIFGLTNVVKR